MQRYSLGQTRIEWLLLAQPRPTNLTAMSAFSERHSPALWPTWGRNTAVANHIILALVDKG